MTTNTGIYQDIATRTAGDIYIGVVGPVRAGKSTFIKRFMETQIIPNIDNVYRRERAKDELPQSGSGRTVMTSEPKFVPEEAVDIALDEGASCSVRLIDCVGYMVPGAAGQLDGDSPRMVTTPWADHPVTMAEAAELGTTRVIREHSTIGIVITTDGSFVLDRQDVLPFEDGAFLQSYRWLYKTTDIAPVSVKKKCAKWKPYSSIAARYLYRVLDLGLTREEFHLFK